jgi:hypothetical protein
MKIITIRPFIEIFMCAALVLMVILYMKRNREYIAEKEKLSAKSTLKSPTAPIVKTFTDPAGDNHIELLANAGQIPKAELKDTVVTNHTFLDSAAKRLGIKDSQIQELTRENLAVKAENIQLKAKKDTLGNTDFVYHDAHLDIGYNTLTNRADLVYHVNIITGRFTPASWLPFSHKPALLDLSADDPRSIINNVQHLSTIVPEPFIGFAADVKGMYNVDTRQIIPSVGANLRLGRFHVEGRAWYNQTLKKGVALSYDVIKF